MEARCYQILDVGLRLESDRHEFLADFERNFGRFGVSARQGGNLLDFAYLEEGGARVVIDGQAEALEGHPRPLHHAAQVVTQTMMDRVRAFTVLHAAVVGRRGGALAISGGSGVGKTTLTLALLERGWDYLSDDYCPMDRVTGLAHPFPRSLWVRPARGEGEVPNLHRGKVMVPFEGQGFRTGAEVRPLRWLFCLEPDQAEEGDAHERLRLVVRREGRQPLREALEQIEGLGLELLGEFEWEVRYPRSGGHTRCVRELLHQHRAGLWNAFSVPDHHPDFSRVPELRRLSPHQAAFFLLRELKHQPLGSRPGALMFHLEALLANTVCFGLTPGPLECRIELIENAVKENGA